MSRDQAREAIGKLVEGFREHQKEYHLSENNEQKARQDLVNPFFSHIHF